MIRLRHLLFIASLLAAAGCTGGEQLEPEVNADRERMAVQDTAAPSPGGPAATDGDAAAPEEYETTPQAALEEEARGMAETVENGGLTIEETEQLVRAHLAEERGVSLEAIRTVEATAQTWPDESLGCDMARRVVVDGKPVEGYQIVLAVGEQVYDYRAGAHGDFRRCPDVVDVGKPLDPIR